MAAEYKLSYMATEIDERLGLVSENKKTCDDLTERMSLNEGNVASLQTDVENNASDIDNLQTSLDGKADASSLENFYTKTEVDGMELITTDDIDDICGSTI